LLDWSNSVKTDKMISYTFLDPMNKSKDLSHK
jgi:hypothetical protein